MRSLWVLLFLTLPGLAGDDRPMRWVGDKELQKRIHASIDKGVAYLLSIQMADGRWSYNQFHNPGRGRDPGWRMDPSRRRQAVATARAHGWDGGLTALALYALASSGVRKEHEAVRKALDWVDGHDSAYDKTSDVGTYSLSLLILALTRLDAAGFGSEIRLHADRLAKAQSGSGMWGYKLRAPKRSAMPRIDAQRVGEVDNSNTQLAVLALWAAHSLSGWDAPRSLWRRLEKHYRRTQNVNGTWDYRPHQPGRGGTNATMTAAGLAGYVYARAALDPSEIALQRARGTPTAKQGLKAFRRLLKKPDWENYYLVYSIERVGTVLGLRDLSWYEKGARILTVRQNQKGYWKGRSTGADSKMGYETSLALLFLSRATYPPVKGAITPLDRIDTLSPRERLPMLTKAQSHRRAFEIYLSFEPDARRAEMRTMGARGPGLVDHLIATLELDGRTKARKTAHELLQRLLGKILLFIADGPPEEREVMARAIRVTWERMRDDVKWSSEAGRYVAK
ncbi:MAG: prenyltransferase/squalene oxidase repeat-containing protein [Planctomycetota bacterium]